ncbi:MAG: hypothetical protein RBQ99_01775 [Trichlorobacter sp.]|nr:hypothetical protein [Trichlorobacter sp.]
MVLAASGADAELIAKKKPVPAPTNQVQQKSVLTMPKEGQPDLDGEDMKAIQQEMMGRLNVLLTRKNDVITFKENELREAQGKITKLNESVSAMQADIERKNATIAATSKDIERLRKWEKDIGKQLAEKNTALDNAAKEITLLKVDAVAKDGKNKVLTEETQRLQAENAQLKNEAANQNAVITTLKKDLEFTRKAEAALKKDSLASGETIGLLKKQIAERDETLAATKAERENAARQIEQAKAAAELLKGEAVNKDKLLLAKEAERNALAAEISKLQKALDQNQAAKAAVDQELLKTKAAMSDLQTAAQKSKDAMELKNNALKVAGEAIKELQAKPAEMMIVEKKVDESTLPVFQMNRGLKELFAPEGWAKVDFKGIGQVEVKSAGQNTTLIKMPTYMFRQSQNLLAPSALAFLQCDQVSTCLVMDNGQLKKDTN